MHLLINSDTKTNNLVICRLTPNSLRKTQYLYIYVRLQIYYPWKREVKLTSIHSWELWLIVIPSLKAVWESYKTTGGLGSTEYIIDTQKYLFCEWWLKRATEGVMIKMKKKKLWWGWHTGISVHWCISVSKMGILSKKRKKKDLNEKF